MQFIFISDGRAPKRLKARVNLPHHPYPLSKGLGVTATVTEAFNWLKFDHTEKEEKSSSVLIHLWLR